MFLKGPFFSGLEINQLDISTHFTGFVTSLTFGIGAISGLFAPFLVGTIATEVAML